MGTRQKVTEDELCDVNVVLFVHLYWDALTIVPDGYAVCYVVDFDHDLIHCLVTLVVISSIDQYLIKDFIEPRNIADLPHFEPLILLVHDPHILRHHLGAPDIHIWPEQDMLNLSLALVRFFDINFGGALDHLVAKI